MRNFRVMALTALLLVAPSTLWADEAANDLPVVGSVDLASYLGFWYEVRRIENSFQDNLPKDGSGVCYNTTAEYSLRKKGGIRVKNTCYRSGKGEVAKANARVVKDSNGAKLKVNFTGNPVLEWLGVGDGDYWVLGLGPVNADGLYSWALVGAPDLKFGWILSRTPRLEDVEVGRALAIAESVGYDKRQFKEFLR